MARKKHSVIKNFIMRFFAIVLGLFCGVFLYALKILGGFNYVMTPVVAEEDYELVSIDTSGSFSGGDVSSSWGEGGHTRVYVDPDHPIIQVEQIDPNVENILVFGVDSRGTDDYQCRSDCMMIVSINKSANTVKLVSLMRDIGVYIGDTDESASSSLDKLTHAYAYGGVGLMINTINRNFGLDIQRFAMLDFGSAADVIDMVGGVEIDVQASEVQYANSCIAELNEITDNDVSYLTTGGTQLLNGTQAIGWSRIRYLDSDFVRTSRQRTVATALISEVAGMSRLYQLGLIEDSAGMFETNMQSLDLTRVGFNAVGGAGDIQEYRVPEDNLYTVQQNPWMMILDWDSQLDLLHEFIWG